MLRINQGIQNVPQKKKTDPPPPLDPPPTHTMGLGSGTERNPLCDITLGCCFFIGPWTVTRSSLPPPLGRGHQLSPRRDGSRGHFNFA